MTSILLENLEPALAGLAGVPQDTDYHGEGDALTHTRLVMEQMARQPSFLAMGEDDRQLLLAAAALHDMGKARCTVMDAGRWISPGHSAAGAKVTRELLMTQLGLAGTPEALRLREAVCLLVRWHMRPLHIFGRDDPGQALRQMASAGELTELFTLEKLAVLAEADIRGRICADQAERLEDIALFRALAEEAGCLYGPLPYPDAASRWADMTGRAAVPGQRVYDPTWGTVVMMSGLPGTGKDTYAAARYGGMPMVSLDRVRRELGAAHPGQGAPGAGRGPGRRGRRGDTPGPGAGPGAAAGKAALRVQRNEPFSGQPGPVDRPFPPLRGVRASGIPGDRVGGAPPPEPFPERQRAGGCRGAYAAQLFPAASHGGGGRALDLRVGAFDRRIKEADRDVKNL